MKSFLIYALKEPNTGEIRYFGITGSAFKERMRHHLKGHTQTHCSRWIQSLQQAGQPPLTEVLMTGLTEAEAIEEEIALISWGRGKGFRLTNLTSGGEGTVGFSPRPETREKLRQANLGKKQSLETIEKRILKGEDHWTFGKSRPIGTRDKISEALLGHVQSGTQIEKRRVALQRRRKTSTSGYAGVSWRKDKLEWEAYISFRGTRYRLGYFDDKENAARAYDAAAKYYYGDSAYLNFPQDLEKGGNDVRE